MKLWKYSGILLVATGILHLLVAIVSGWNTYRDVRNIKILSFISTTSKLVIHFTRPDKLKSRHVPTSRNKPVDLFSEVFQFVSETVLESGRKP